MTHGAKPEQKFFVGDIVKVKTGNVACAFNWIPGMDEYKGIHTRIVNARLAHGGRDWRYEIEADDRTHGWCENCFESEVLELPSFEPESTDAIIDLFG